MRKCPRCLETKSMSEFFNRRGKEGSSSYCKDCHNCQSVYRQRQFKIECVNYKGGKCENCGYNKCFNALDFHHLDRTIKEFNISKLRCTNFNKNPQVKIELDKCQLLCANCHREAEFLIQEKKYSNQPEFWKKWLGKQKQSKEIKPKTYCIKCNNENKFGDKYCSLKCSSVNNRKVERPSLEQLKQDLLELPMTKVGNKYGVSDNTIRKWLKFYEKAN